MSEPAIHNVANPAGRLKIALLGYRSNPFSGGQGIYLRYLSSALTEDELVALDQVPELDRIARIEIRFLDLVRMKQELAANIGAVDAARPQIECGSVVHR